MSSEYVSLNRGRPRPSRKRELMALAALVVSISGFVLQTEVLGVVAQLGYQKPMLVMYVTHCCMMLLLPLQVVVLGLRQWWQRGDSLATFAQKHRARLERTGLAVARLNGWKGSPRRYAWRAAAVLAVALNCAGASWYIAVNLTTTADLTAIYNCSAFFAYAFSVWLLHERFNAYKAASVALSVVGVVAVAYLGGSAGGPGAPGHRMAGNAIIAAGTVLYGLYEVLYKRIACPPQSVPAAEQAAFANLIGAAIGVGTLALMWPVLIVLHVGGWERMELPSRQVAGYLVLSVVGNVSFSGAFLVLMSLTSPVLGSVSSLLATCAVPVVNYVLWHERVTAGEVAGGLLILAAFALLTWASADDFVEEEER